MKRQTLEKNNKKGQLAAFVTHYQLGFLWYVKIALKKQ